MNAPKKNASIGKSSVAGKTAKPKLFEKLNPAKKIQFVVGKDVDFNDCEIRITFKGNNIVTKFLLKGVPISEQVILVKPNPTPPPIPTIEFKQVNQIKL